MVEISNLENLVVVLLNSVQAEVLLYCDLTISPNQTQPVNPTLLSA